MSTVINYTATMVIYSFVHFQIYVIFGLMRIRELELSFLLFFIQNLSNCHYNFGILKNNKSCFLQMKGLIRVLWFLGKEEGIIHYFCFKLLYYQDVRIVLDFIANILLCIACSSPYMIREHKNWEQAGGKITMHIIQEIVTVI